MESTGARLKNLRLEKGLTLEDVHKKTKIHPDILKALEEDSFINLSPIYIKGFLKIYCKFLGVDPRDYISDYQEPGLKVTAATSPDTKIKPHFISKIRSKLNYLDFAQLKKIIFIVILISIFAIVLFNLGKTVSAKFASRKVKAKVKTSGEVKASTAATHKSLPVKTLPPGPQKEVSVLIRLGIRAKEDCWVNLKVDGKTVFQRILKKGRFESWDAVEKIELSLGNAAAVDLEVNGKTISNLGRRGQPVKNILINKEGINIAR